jgi:putative ABC transport system ATP-binding protein
VLSLTNAWKTFRSGEVETVALKDVSLSVESGEFVAISGPSGCGKSTLLNVLGTLDRLTAGTYSLGGQYIQNWSEDQLAIVRQRYIGFVFQTFHLLENMSVKENVALALRYQSIHRKERDALVAAAMRRMGIAHRSNHRPSRLSGGQQQRAAIARAIVSSPSFILADEPTGNLDSHHGEEVMSCLEQLNQQGATIIMVTHSAEHAARARRCITLSDGEIVQDASP